MALIARVEYGTQRAYHRGVFLVDGEDFEEVKRFNWCISTYGYIVRRGEGGIVWLHRSLLGLEKGDKRRVDHINGDRLDNRRSNLRICTQRENSQNLHGRRSNNTSGFRGVTWSKSARSWVAQATLDYQRFYLGCFRTAEEAAEAVVKFRVEHMPFSEADQSA